ncbi:hypothetical protein GCM10022278_14420 [Allohahella marinimesophila]|uniref:Uncharacterized protein n=1 Tax=Allohahella marinimesophila TaxID=1054972 RepID=A0ABP7NZ39_9GAMM
MWKLDERRWNGLADQRLVKVEEDRNTELGRECRQRRLLISPLKMYPFTLLLDLYSQVRGQQALKSPVAHQGLAKTATGACQIADDTKVLRFGASANPEPEGRYGVQVLYSFELLREQICRHALTDGK